MKKITSLIAVAIFLLAICIVHVGVIVSPYSVTQSPSSVDFVLSLKESKLLITYVVLICMFIHSITIHIKSFKDDKQ